jgi:formylmethanofuran dehydrogenase subunit A
MELLIKNGYVYDPINGINGDKMDIAIKNGKIVTEKSINSPNSYKIDASNKVVMPGGIDIHTHIAGPKLNVGRMMRPEDHLKTFMKSIPGVRRSGTGRTTPTTNLIGYKYARMGWTTAIEPATPPLETRHTHEELNDIPILDKACFPLLDSNWFVLNFLQNKDYDKCAAFIGWIMDAIKGYAIKIVDPGAAEFWSIGKGVGICLDDTLPGLEITPREIVRGLCKVNKMLNLPHPIHVHCNRLGFPGNFCCTLDTMDTVSDLVTDDTPNIHITHVQFTGYAGDDWFSLRSGADEIAKYVNTHKHVTLDLGQVIFGDATTMTADAPFEFVLHHLAPGKWSSTDIEAENCSGIVPYKFRKKNYVNTVQWTIGLEIMLLVKDPWRVFPTTDHPNAGPFTKYPVLISWLMSKKAREDIIKEVNKKALKKAILPSIDREYDLYEIAITTRAAPSKILNLPEKGHLGEGADADIAIYEIDPKNTDYSNEYEQLIKSFRRTAYTLKDGEIVVKDGAVTKHTYGKTYYVKPSIPKELSTDISTEISQKFKEWYSVNLSNYVIAEKELRKMKAIDVKTSLE